MQDLFDAYVRAFCAGDFAAIERRFAYPCLIENRSGVEVIHDAGGLALHLEGILSGLRAHRVVDAEAVLLEQGTHGANHHTAAVHYRFFDADGATPWDYDYLYTLVRDPFAENGDVPWRIRLACLTRVGAAADPVVSAFGGD